MKTMLDRKAISEELRRVIKRLYYLLEVMRVCARWCAAYPLSTRNFEEIMAERSVTVDQVAVHRWGLKILPMLAKASRWRQRPVGKSWRLSQTYALAGGHCNYLYRAVDKTEQTVDFLLTARRDEAAARRFFERAMNLQDLTNKITVDKNCANTAVVRVLIDDGGVAIELHQSTYLNTIIEQDHRATKRRTRPMLGFKAYWSARRVLSGNETMCMIGKGLLRRFVGQPLSAQASSTAWQFERFTV